MAKVILICGKICSGKSTYAEQLRIQNNAVLLSTDEITLALFGQHCGDKHDDYVERTQNYLFNKSLELIEVGINVILDWGFWSREGRRRLTDFYDSLNIPCEWHYIDVDDQTWYKNILERNSRVLNDNSGSDYYLDEGLLCKCLSLWEAPTEDEIDVRHRNVR